jgi:hypothetical protein
MTAEVVVCQPMGCLTDTKGNKIAGFDSIDKKQVNKDKLSSCYNYNNRANTEAINCSPSILPCDGCLLGVSTIPSLFASTLSEERTGSIFRLTEFVPDVAKVMEGKKMCWLYQKV